MKQRSANHTYINRIMRGVPCGALRIMILSLIVLLTASCSMMNDVAEDCDNNGKAKWDGTTYLTVQVGLGEESVTRAGDEPAESPGPDGGSDGEGNEIGFENEYKVDDLTLMFFKKADGFTNLGNDGNKDNVILDTYYFNSFNPVTIDGKNAYYTSINKYKLNPTYMSGDYKYCIIANAGDVGSTYKGKNVVSVANDLLKGGWSDGTSMGISGAPAVTNPATGASLFTKFLMTSDNQLYGLTSKETSGTGSEQDPYVAFGKIKRIAARIDFMVDYYTSNCKDKKTVEDINSDAFKEITISDTKYSGFIYDVVDENGSVIGKYLLTHVLPFNCLKDGAYFLKHVFSPDWDLNKAEGISHLVEFMKLEKEVWTCSNNTLYKYSTNWVLDPWSKLETECDGTNKRYTYKSSSDKHVSTLYNNYLDKKTTASADLLSVNNWNYGWDDYKTRKVEFDCKDDNGCSYIMTYTNENTVVGKNAYDNATGVIFRGIYFTTEQWNSGSPSSVGKDIAYKYYLRHSDPEDKFNETGNPDETAINNMTISKENLSDNKGALLTGTDKSKYDNVTLKNTMLYGIVRNNIYRVSINKVMVKNNKELTIIPKISVRKWATYEHDELVM